MRKSNSITIDIVVTVYPRHDGRFEAHHAARVLCVSREPLLEAARRLLAEGFPPGAVLGLRHTGQPDFAFRSRLARAAALTVRDGADGVPRFRRWKASPYGRVSPPMRFLVPLASQKTGGAHEAPLVGVAKPVATRTTPSSHWSLRPAGPARPVAHARRCGSAPAIRKRPPVLAAEHRRVRLRRRRHHRRQPAGHRVVRRCPVLRNAGSDLAHTHEGVACNAR